MKQFFCALAALSLASVSLAALPTAGDVVFIGMQADDEAFALLTLETNLDLRGLNYTDNEFVGPGFSDQNEGEGTFPTDLGWSNVPSSTVVVIGNGTAVDNDPSDGYLSAPYTDTNVNLSGSGDAMVVFAAAADYSNATSGDIIAGGLVATAASSWSSHGALDTLGLTSWAVISAGANDNMVYGGTTSGTAQAVVAEIESSGNWSGSDSAGNTSFQTTFNLTTTLPVELDFFMVE